MCYRMSIVEPSLACSHSVILTSCIAFDPATAGTPTSCASLTTSRHPDTTINSAQSQIRAAPTWRRTRGISRSPTCRPTARSQATISADSDSSIGVQVWMPTQRYNGRYLGTGNGGYAGGFFYSELADGINRGFATANTDMGATGGAGVNGDALVGHPEKWKDFGWRATHLMTVFTKALINAFYGNPPQPLLFRRLLHRRPAGTDGGATLPQRLRRHPRRRARLQPHAHPHRADRAISRDARDAGELHPGDQVRRDQPGGAGAMPRQGRRRARPIAFLTDPRDCKFDPATLPVRPASTDRPASTRTRSPR